MKKNLYWVGQYYGETLISGYPLSENWNFGRWTQAFKVHKKWRCIVWSMCEVPNLPQWSINTVFLSQELALAHTRCKDTGLCLCLINFYLSKYWNHRVWLPFFYPCRHMGILWDWAFLGCTWNLLIYGLLSRAFELCLSEKCQKCKLHPQGLWMTEFEFGTMFYVVADRQMVNCVWL